MPAVDIICGFIKSSGRGKLRGALSSCALIMYISRIVTQGAVHHVVQSMNLLLAIGQAHRINNAAIIGQC